MNEVMLESARQNTALQQALAVSLEMAALAWDDDAADAREFAAAVREQAGLRCVRAAVSRERM